MGGKQDGEILVLMAYLLAKNASVDKILKTCESYDLSVQRKVIQPSVSLLGLQYKGIWHNLWSHWENFVNNSFCSVDCCTLEIFSRFFHLAGA